MARKLASDKVLFGALVALSLFGCVMIYSASAVSSGETSGNPYRFLLKQIAALREQLLQDSAQIALEVRSVLTPEQLERAGQVRGRMKQLQSEMQQIYDR